MCNEAREVRADAGFKRGDEQGAGDRTDIHPPGAHCVAFRRAGDSNVRWRVLGGSPRTGLPGHDRDVHRVPEADLRDAVLAALGGEVMTLAALRARLGPPWDRPVGRDDLDRLLQSDTSFLEVSRGFVSTPALLEGTTWTVHIDPDDGAEGFVRTHPDLSVLAWWLIGDDVAILDEAGRHLGVLETDGWMVDGEDTDVVLGPEGWLDGLSGGWARVDVVGGALRWSQLERPPSATRAQVDAVRAGFERAVDEAEEQRSVHLAPVPPGLRFVAGSSSVEEALLIDPGAFRDDPIPRLGDLYAAAGLVQRGAIVAHEGFDWDTLTAWQDRNRLVMSYQLTPTTADALAGFLTELDASLDESTGVGTPALSVLDDGAIAAAAWQELERRALPLEDLARIAGASATSDTPSIGAAWLRSRVLDRSGDATAAHEVLEAAVGPDCEHRPALVDLAGLRADRGDAVGALRLLTQAGVDPETDDDELEPGELLWDEVEGFATSRPRPTARRNDHCPCGSGRKYKVCHLGRETHSLDDRAAWLFAKARRFLHDRRPYAVEELAALVVDEIDDDDLFDRLVDGPLLDDVVLHEDGVFSEFLAARDHLLPDDEAMLAAQWALVDRGVFEVLDTTAAQLELRDVARGDRIRVVNVQPGASTRPGMLLVGRPLPVGETYRAFSGFVPLPLGRQDTMLEAIEAGDSEAIANVLASIFAPPQLANTDGHKLAGHTITWRVARPRDVSAALVGAGLMADGDDEWTLIRDSKNQDDTLIASAALRSKELTVEVNSAERAAELKQLVADALPDAELIDVEVEPFKMPANRVPTSGTRPADVNDPAIRAALAEHVAGYERRWLDESIPALGGRTPREAAADPIGREELNRLLASFPVPDEDEIGMMSPARLRAALGL